MEHADILTAYAAIIAGWTQLLSDMIERFMRQYKTDFRLGDWKQLIALLLGALGTYLSLSQPELLNQITILISGGGATGLISFLLKKFVK